MNDGKHLLYGRQGFGNHIAFGLMHQSQHKGVVSVRGTHMFLADFSKPSPSTFTITV
jgi:hypothetical protein